MSKICVQRRHGESLQIGATVVTVRIPKGRGRRVVLCVASPPGIEVLRIAVQGGEGTIALGAEDSPDSAAAAAEH